MTELRAEVYKDLTGRWRWRIKSPNGDTLADSGQGYINKADCLHGLSLVAGEEPRQWTVTTK